MTSKNSSTNSGLPASEAFEVHRQMVIALFIATLLLSIFIGVSLFYANVTALIVVAAAGALGGFVSSLRRLYAFQRVFPVNFFKNWHKIDLYLIIYSMIPSLVGDYIRSPKLKLMSFILRFPPLFIRIIKIFPFFRRWKSGQGIDALADLEPYVYATKNNGLKVLVFGEPFTYGGLGVHNIHQNQGDPITSQWAAENGIWQDGCTILQQPDNAYVAFLNKFSSQSNYTDDQGHPL